MAVHKPLLSVWFCFALAACGDVLGIAENPQLVAAGPWDCLGSPPTSMAPQKERASVEVNACN
ncbi:MAG TPA: hypothetical protein VHZ95_17415, partial [Polyangiales bacterium]|nr:hypothetical protein [Polyangiales bacterium]